jgi:hypothetical protein
VGKGNNSYVLAPVPSGGDGWWRHKSGTCACARRQKVVCHQEFVSSMSPGCQQFLSPWVFQIATIPSRIFGHSRRSHLFRVIDHISLNNYHFSFSFQTIFTMLSLLERVCFIAVDSNIYFCILNLQV